MKEKDIQTIFGKKNKTFGVFELKLCKGKSIRYDAVAEHQMKALKDVGFGGKGLYHKINDLPVFPGCKTRFASKKPFDCFYLKFQNSYIVVCFYLPRKEKLFCYITPEAWEESEKESDRKSIRKEEAIKISHHFLQA